MASKRATLIQDFCDFRQAVEPYLRPILAQFTHGAVTMEEAIKWIVCEELELQAGLFEKAHVHNHQHYLLIYQKLTNAFPRDFSVWFGQVIRMPRVYDFDNGVDVILTPWDLFIIYYSVTVDLPFFEDPFYKPK